MKRRWLPKPHTQDKRNNWFAAIPPLEAIRALISMAASQRKRGNGPYKKLSFIGIRKAYFHAKAKRLMYVVLPEEFCEPGEFGQV